MDGEFRELPPAEVALRERLLERFASRDTTYAQRIHATAFQDALAELGLSFGNEVVDRVMLECRIDDAGMVDFSRFAGSVVSYQRQLELFQRRADAVASLASPRRGPATPARGAAPASASGDMLRHGAEFREALEASVGPVPRESLLPLELRGLSQSQRVRRMARQLNAIFNDFDHGRCSLDVFREQLRQIGVDETPEATRLLRSASSITFAQLFRALCSTEDAAPPSGRSAGSPSVPTRSVAATDPAAGRRPGSLRSSGAVGDHDVITWSSDGYADSMRSSITGEGAGRAPGAYNTSASTMTPFGSAESAAIAAATVAAGVRTTGSGRSTGGYDARHAAESGAGAVIFGRGGSAGGGSSSSVAEIFGGSATSSSARGLSAARGLASSHGVADALRDDVIPLTADARYESVTQATARRVAAAGDRPLTSAGYGSADQGLLREQIYSLVRQLDAGGLSVRAFRERVRELGVEVTPTVERLLMDYESNGKADFSRFVRAFEDFFATHSRPLSADEVAAGYGAYDHSSGSGSGSGSAPSPYATHAGVPASKTSTVAPPRRIPEAVRSHGDILAWSSAEVSEAEEREGLKRVGLRPLLARDRAIYDVPSTSADIIAWEDARRGPAAALAAADHHSRRGTGDRAVATRNAGNIIAWAGGVFSDAPSATSPSRDTLTGVAGVMGDPAYTGTRGGRGGDLLPDGTPLGRGRGRPHTELADRGRTFEIPFGTAADLEPPASARDGGRGGGGGGAGAGMTTTTSSIYFGMGARDADSGSSGSSSARPATVARARASAYQASAGVSAAMGEGDGWSGSSTGYRAR